MSDDDKLTDVDKLYKLLSYFNETSTERLLSTSDGLLTYFGGFDVVNDLKKYIRLIDQINDLNDVPKRITNHLLNRLHVIKLRFDHFNQKEKQTHSSDDRQIEVIRSYLTTTGSNGFLGQYDNLILTVQEAMLFSDADPMEKKKQLNDLIKSATKTEKQIKNLLVGVAEESSKSGIAKHARIFNTQSSVNKKRANAWKIWAVGLSVALISFATIIFYEHKDTYSIQVAIYSALVIAVLFYAISISVKSFFGEMHNHVVNRHKANCLNTFKTLIETADKDNAHVILKLATETIFSHQTSGFLKRESSSSSPSPILEIIKNASQTNTT